MCAVQVVLHLFAHLPTDSTSSVVMKMDENESDTIKLIACDDTQTYFEIGREGAKLIDIVRNFCEEDDDDSEEEDTHTIMKSEPIPLDHVKFKALEKVVKFCQRCVDHPKELDDLNQVKLPIQSFHPQEVFPPWHADFISKMSVGDLFELLAAAHYMGVHPLEKMLSVPVSILITVYDSTGKPSTILDRKIISRSS